KLRLGPGDAGRTSLQRSSIALAIVSESVRALTNGRVSFGTSGARGLVQDLADDVCAAYPTAFISVVRRGFVFDRIAVGMDLRPSSPRIAAACVAAATAAGLEVDWCGELPTPALALHGIARGIPSLMVSGSHIPFDRNGLKFYRPDGEISKRDEQEML